MMKQSPSMDVGSLKEQAKKMRRKALDVVHHARSGHLGGSFSEAEILVTLYFDVLTHNPSNPQAEHRDRFILSKGHACPIFYAILAECGYFPEEELFHFRTINNLLQGHPTNKIPGVEMDSGSLGQGISFGIGCALSAKMDNAMHKIYVMVGDGELQEGQIWEAAMTASHHHLDNLIVIVDKNKIQNDWFVDQTKSVDPLADKWRAFGWHVLEVDGHSVESLQRVFKEAQQLRGKPIVIIAHTIKGKGVSFMENNPHFHGSATTQEQYQLAVEELSK